LIAITVSLPVARKIAVINFIWVEDNIKSNYCYWISKNWI